LEFGEEKKEDKRDKILFWVTLINRSIVMKVVSSLISSQDVPSSTGLGHRIFSRFSPVAGFLRFLLPGGQHIVERIVADTLPARKNN